MFCEEKTNLWKNENIHHTRIAKAFLFTMWEMLSRFNHFYREIAFLHLPSVRLRSILLLWRAHQSQATPVGFQEIYGKEIKGNLWNYCCSIVTLGESYVYTSSINKHHDSRVSNGHKHRRGRWPWNFSFLLVQLFNYSIFVFCFLAKYFGS